MSAGPSTNDEPSAKRLVTYAMAARNIHFVVMAATTLVVSPLLLRHLGVAKYGTWALIVQLTGYYGLLDWGLRGTVSHFVAAYIPSRRSEELNAIFSSAFYGLVLVAALAIGVGIGLAFVIDRLFNLAGTSPLEVRSAFLIVTLTIACGLPFEAFTAVVYGCRRSYLLSGIESGIQLLSAVAIVSALSLGGGLVSLAAIQLLCRTFSWGFAVWNAWRLLPTLQIGRRLIDRAALVTVGHYGSRSFLINLSSFVINRADLIVVGAFTDVTMVARYTVGQTLVDYASIAVSNITQAFTPHFTKAFGEGADADIRHFYIRGARLSGAVAALLASGLSIYGVHFIRLWLGNELLSGPWWQRSDVILTILIIGQLPRFFQSISWQLFFGVRDVNFPAVVQVAEATLNLALSLWLVKMLGPAGVAIGSTVPLLISNLVLVPERARRTLRMSLGEYLRLCIAPSVGVGVMVALSGLLLTVLAPPTRWVLFTAEVSVSAFLGGSVGMPLVLTTEEQRAVIALIRTRVAGTISRRHEGGPPA